MVEIIGVPLGDKRLEEFVRVPWELNARLDGRSVENRKYWRTPLRLELLGTKFPGIKATGLLTPEHPYHQHARVMHWIAKDHGKLVGRISAAFNTMTIQKGKEFETAGFFGFFETTESKEVYSALMNEATEWLIKHGCTRVMGPGGYSNATFEPYQGILIEGFDTPPSVELTHNPPFYGEIMDGMGFTKAKDYVTYDFKIGEVEGDYDKRAGLMKKCKESVKEAGLIIRPLNKAHLKKDIKILADVYNEAWKDNWGFVNITAAEGEAMADSLESIVVPELILFAERGTGVNAEPVAIFGGIPDPMAVNRPVWPKYRPLTSIANNEALRMVKTLVGHPPHIRIMFMGIKKGERKRPLAGALFYGLYDILVKRGYKTADASILLEDNLDVINLSKGFGGKYAKRYRIYQKNL